jgi:hypothetical protein
MDRALGVLLLCGLALAAAASAGAAATANTPGETVSVHVQHRPSVRENVHVTFHAGARLPAGGYYYAVIVLKPYGRYTRQHPPPCSSSSNMERADYGYPGGDGGVRLALTPSRSATWHWCRRGSYLGAIYAVPHPPPCEARYPCRSEPYEPPSPCWEVAAGHRVCGVVARPRGYAYPSGIPAPLAADTRIVGRFSVVFD